jgi:hypothetical protein
MKVDSILAYFWTPFNGILQYKGDSDSGLIKCSVAVASATAHISGQMIWTAYIDEADSHGAPVMAMGGFLSPANKWDDFNNRWSGALPLLAQLDPLAYGRSHA